MNIMQRAVAGAGLLLLSAALFFKNLWHDLKENVAPRREPLEHGEFRMTGICPNPEGKRAMIGAALLALSVCCLLSFFVNPVHILAYVSLVAGAAGTFSLKAPANAPLPQYTFLGVFTGGTSDTSPLSITFSTYNATFATRCNGVAPIPYLYLVQVLANVTAMAITCTSSALVLTFTSSGSALSGFIATLGATIPNTNTQP